MLKNKNVFITGGNRGIGRGLVNILEKDNNVIFSVRESAKGCLLYTSPSPRDS